jgi:hypothetical protein
VGCYHRAVRGVSSAALADELPPGGSGTLKQSRQFRGGGVSGATHKWFWSTSKAVIKRRTSACSARHLARMQDFANYASVLVSNAGKAVTNRRI